MGISTFSQQTVNTGASNPLGTGNVIINGAFDIWQRGTSFGTASVGQYTADRWRWDGSGVASVTSTQRHSIVSDLPTPGATGYAIKITNNSVGDFNIAQAIEDVNTLNGQTVTFSFWARSDAPGSILETYLIQNFGSGGSSGTITLINSTGTTSTSWKRFVGTATIPSTSGKTVGAGSSLVVRIDPGNDATGTYYIWGVQLEAGSTATPFRRNANSLQGELAACQRYYYRNSTPLGIFALGYAASATSGRYVIDLPTTMRVTPTSLEFGSGVGTSDMVTYDMALTALVIDSVSGPQTIRLTSTVASGQTAFRPQGLIGRGGGSDFVGFSAEL
jgi:hypothetical protein